MMWRALSIRPYVKVLVPAAMEKYKVSLLDNRLMEKGFVEEELKRLRDKAAGASTRPLLIST